MNNKTAFHHAIKLIIETVSFNKNVTVQVFEVTIRLTIVTNDFSKIINCQSNFFV